MATENVNVVISAQDKATPVLQSVQKNANSAFAGISGTAVALAGAVAGVAVSLYSAVQAAAESQKEMAAVDGILKTMNGNFEENRKLVDQAAAAAAKLGFDDEEAAKATALLYQRTGNADVVKSMNSDIMPGANNVKRAANVDMLYRILPDAGKSQLLSLLGVENVDPKLISVELQKTFLQEVQKTATQYIQDPEQKTLVSDFFSFLVDKAKMNPRDIAGLAVYGQQNPDFGKFVAEFYHNITVKNKM